MNCELVAPEFQKYEQELLNFIKKRLKDPMESEEVLNQVLMKVYTHCEKLPAVRNNRSWLYRITRNALYDYFRENQRWQHLDDEMELEDKTEESLINSLEPLIPVIIKMLPEKMALPLYLSDIEGVPQKEIAVKLGISVSGAKSRIQRAREQLKALFFECCYLELDQKGMPVSFSVKENCAPLLPYQPKGVVSVPTGSPCCDQEC